MATDHYGSYMEGKMQGKDSVRSLPAPMDYPSLSSALLELGVGMRKAVETCLECWKNNRLTDEDLVSFLRSIKAQSPTLASKFDVLPSKPQQSLQIASAEDMAELRALAGLGGFGCVMQPSYYMTATRQPVVFKAEPSSSPPQFLDSKNIAGAFTNPFAPARASNLFDAKPAFPAIPVPAAKTPSRSRRSKNAAPSNEEQILMEEWRTRRAAEVLRRQSESGAAPTRAAYLRYVLAGLARALPPAGRAALLDAVRSCNAGRTTDAELAAAVRGLVDRHAVVLGLRYTPEHEVRKPARRSARSLEALELDDLDDDALHESALPDDDEPPLPAAASPSAAAAAGRECPAAGCRGPAAAECASAGCKRKRGAEPGRRAAAGAEAGGAATAAGGDEESAVCPVCAAGGADGAVEDERWVKCDGCATWYHQICVLFNEPAHGKSVRFFCRTPGCRKRGSRQLNRRMRKPCYPVSPSLDATAVADRITAEVAEVARQDRQVVVKTVASRSSPDGDHRRRTLMAFQHTLTGSDLLFFALIVDEQRSQGRFVVSHVDSNGHYEEATPGERVRVEAAIVHSLLRHARDAGYSSVRVCLAPPAAGGLFHARPAHRGWAALPQAVAEVTDMLRGAADAGLLSGLTAPPPATAHKDGAAVVFSARLGRGVGAVAGGAGAADAEEADLPCPLALGREELLGFMRTNVYRFDSLQVAKYSSMMLVYHLAKGWRKDPRLARGAAAAGAACASDAEEEEMEEEAAAGGVDAGDEAVTEDVWYSAGGGAAAAPMEVEGEAEAAEAAAEREGRFKEMLEEMGGGEGGFYHQHQHQQEQQLVHQAGFATVKAEEEEAAEAQSYRAAAAGAAAEEEAGAGELCWFSDAAHVAAHSDDGEHCAYAAAATAAAAGSPADGWYPPQHPCAPAGAGAAAWYGGPASPSARGAGDADADALGSLAGALGSWGWPASGPAAGAPACGGGPGAARGLSPPSSRGFSPGAEEGDVADPFWDSLCCADA